jgi:septum formation protein
MEMPVTDQKKIILASRSPRREHLIHGLDMPVKVIHPPEIDESYPFEMDPIKVPEYLAVKKSRHFNGRLEPDEILVTADTVVLLHGRIVNKPADLEEARQMLRRLSGHKHRVITGVCLRSAIKEVTFASHTDVYFSDLNSEEIDYYLAAYKPLDKAGAYGIQEWIGYIGIERIEGSFFNVMGLPLHHLYMELKVF